MTFQKKKHPGIQDLMTWKSQIMKVWVVLSQKCEQGKELIHFGWAFWNLSRNLESSHILDKIMKIVCLFEKVSFQYQNAATIKVWERKTKLRQEIGLGIDDAWKKKTIVFFISSTHTVAQHSGFYGLSLHNNGIIKSNQWECYTLMEISNLP